MQHDNRSMNGTRLMDASSGFFLPPLPLCYWCCATHGGSSFFAGSLEGDYLGGVTPARRPSSPDGAPPPGFTT